MDSALSSRWRMLSQPRRSASTPRGLDRLWHQAAGRIGRLARRPDRFLRQAEAIQNKAETYGTVSDSKLCDLAASLRQRYRLGRDTPADLEKSLAIAGEAALRTIGLRPYREQIAAALALGEGCVVEMATGEGKTLAAAMAAVMAGWQGRGCHIITANDYLVGRDAGMMQPLYRFCGLTVGCVTQAVAAAKRKEAYDADVTYCTSKEVAADFLRDRLLLSGNLGLAATMIAKMADSRIDRVGRVIQRGLAFAIVDEADAVLIDDASTPLLISGKGSNPEHVEAYAQAARLAADLNPSTDFHMPQDRQTVLLTERGKQHLAELAAPLGGLWTGRRRREELVVQALVARVVYVRDRHYVIEDNKVIIVDQSTGRLMPDRTWRNGLHQAVEAKEGVPIQLPQETYARISFQRFFRRYGKLSGMSGTVAEAHAELWGIYRLPLVRMPTHRPCRRTVKHDRIFTTDTAKWQAVVREICRIHQTGRPVLVGTGSIQDSDRLSRQLRAKHLEHELLNAVHEASEARIIAAAGQKGRITVSTNMAGRGTDIRLGPGVAELGGLHVIATERFSARRTDRQLSGRSARQGDPGSAQAFVSLEDPLILENAPVLTALFRRWCGKADGECGALFGRRLVELLQRRAQRLSFRLRRDILTSDNWLDQNLGFTDRD